MPRECTVMPTGAQARALLASIDAELGRPTRPTRQIGPGPHIDLDEVDDQGNPTYRGWTVTECPILPERAGQRAVIVHTERSKATAAFQATRLAVLPDVPEVFLPDASILSEPPGRPP